MLRYRDNAGSTRRSENAAQRNLHKLGKLTSVKGYIFQGRYGKNAAVMVYGENGTARFNGFSWGYGGTGPNGLKNFLTTLGIDEATAKTVAFQTPWDTDTVNTAWELSLTPACETKAA